MNLNTRIYRHPQVTWTKAQCEKFMKKTHKDAYGTPDPYPGMYHQKVGPVTYNGGCVREHRLWDGESYSLPKVPASFTWKHIASWSRWQLIKSEDAL